MFFGMFFGARKRMETSEFRNFKFLTPIVTSLTPIFTQNGPKMTKMAIKLDKMIVLT